MRKYAKKHGYIIAGEYIDDGISGTKYSQRDELQRMLADVEEGKIDLLIFTRLDRFFRSVRHYTAAQAILDKHNVGWTAIWEPMMSLVFCADALRVAHASVASTYFASARPD